MLAIRKLYLMFNGWVIMIFYLRKNETQTHWTICSCWKYRSTDSTLKLWDRESKICKRSYEGHQNEKNFVGLSTNGDWISCGSECNTVFTYHKEADKPIATYTFPVAVNICYSIYSNYILNITFRSMMMKIYSLVLSAGKKIPRN